MRTHAYLSRDFTRLNKKEIAWIESFIVRNAALSLGEYAMLVNRMSVTDETIRHGNRTRVWALLLEGVTLEVRLVIENESTDS